MLAYSNPYYRQNLLGFFWQMLGRIWGLLTGENLELASDEIQMLVLVMIAASSALVGCLLVLRRMTMLANALSHTILLGIVIAYLLTAQAHTHSSVNVPAMLLASLIMGIVTTFLTEFLTKTVRLQEDASIGLVFTSLFALGVILITLFTRNAHIGAEVVMGNVDALHRDDIKLGIAVLFLNLLLLTLFFKEYAITTFDAGLAKSLGFSAGFFNYLLMSQVAATAIGAFRAVGVLMVLAFITGPPLTARLLTDRLSSMLAISIGVGVGCSLVGVALSRHILTVYGAPLSTAGLTVCLLVAAFLAAVVLAPRQGILAQRRLKKRELKRVEDRESEPSKR